jgi:hypothetical protein
LLGVRAVVGGIHDDVVCDVEVVQRFEDKADVLVMVNPRVVIWALEAAGMPDALLCTQVKSWRRSWHSKRRFVAIPS